MTRWEYPLSRHERNRSGSLACLLGALVASASAQSPPCEPEWSNQFPWTSVYDSISSVIEFDSGSGPALFVGGQSAQSLLPSSAVLRWQPGYWCDAGAVELGGAARCFASFDDGSGEMLYVGGSSLGATLAGQSGVVRLNSRSWEPLMPYDPLNTTHVHALCVYDDGYGPSLYAAGGFYSGTPAGHRGVTRWNGRKWLPVGGWFDGFALSLCAFDDGGGTKLYAGGGFSQAAGTPASRRG